MGDLIINILWLLIFIILLAGVIYLAIWVIEKFIYPIPELVKQGIWVIALLLVLIAIVTLIVGGGNFRSFWGKKAGASDRSDFVSTTEHLQGMLERG